MSSPAKLGDTVRVHLRIELEDGFVAEDTFADEPVTAVLGHGDIHACLERCLVGMRPGEQKTISLEPEEAFGLRSTQAIHTLPKEQFQERESLEVGQILAFRTPGGQRVPGAIRAIEERHVVVDFNHPLAGHRLNIRIRLVDILPGRED